MDYCQLTQEERYQIWVLRRAGHGIRSVAREVCRAPSTVSREIRRNTGGSGYRAHQAHGRAVQRRRQARKARRLSVQLCGWIDRLLIQDLSPKQVSGYLRRHKRVRISHETIYQYVFRDQALGGELYKHLRVGRKPYKRRYGLYQQRSWIRNRVGIEKRPNVVDRRSRIGDWEADTVIGARGHSAILTLVERKTLYTVIARLSRRKAEELADAHIRVMQPFKARLKTITYDNGTEFAAHERIARALDVDVYFANPHRAWERGINENTNGLIRQYFPKGTDFNEISDEAIRHAADRLNRRPRETRNFRSPNELFLGQRDDLLA